MFKQHIEHKKKTFTEISAGKRTSISPSIKLMFFYILKDLYLSNFIKIFMNTRHRRKTFCQLSIFWEKWKLETHTSWAYSL